MDPLTAFSLACNVIQIIDFSAKIVTKCKELYKDGALAKNRDIESVAKSLANVSTDLKLPETFPSAESVQQGYQEDEDLLKLAQQCSETANELICELQKLAIQGTHRKRDAVLKAIKETWNKSIIEGIEERLEQHRRTLNTLILINLRQHARKVSTEQTKAFKDLDRKVQTLINAVAENQAPFAALKELIQNGNTSCKKHVNQEVEKLRVRIACEDSYKSFLESLYFPDIHARQEGIEEAHKNTFEWIFEKPTDYFQPWHDFVHWLESGHGTYWISGKAGSGKSTLMNLICQDPRTIAALRIWSGTNEVLLPKFFFWNAGTELQKSSRGLLRSIIYQIMVKAPELMPVLERSIGTTQQRTQQLPTWTERRLLATLQHLLRYGLQSYPLCIFVDGLDEFSSHQDYLLELIRDFRQYSNIKICLSSRPYRLFRDEFGSSAMLKLQDLTEPDIRKYTLDKLERARPKTSQALDASLRLGEIASMIIQRAEGVFLWVKLAVRDQLEGIRNYDNADQLLERIHVLPDEIEGIYLHMLQRIDKVYWKEVAQYFYIVLNFGDPSLFSVALAVYDRIDDILLFSPDLSFSEIRRHCLSTKERIATTCQGILEVRETHRHQCQFVSFKSLADQIRPPERCNDPIGLKCYRWCSRVSFLHRTARDFINENGEARRLLEASASISPHPHLIYVKAMLAELLVIPLSTDNKKIRGSIQQIMEQAATAEHTTELAQPALMGLLDRSISILCQRSRDHPSNVHWCRLWGHPEVSGSPRDANIQVLDYFEDDGILNIIPTDFLGFAASFGLYLYVSYTIDSQAEPRTCSTIDYLLGCALHGPDYSHNGMFNWRYLDFLNPHLKLIRALLERGADPQTGIPGSTAWGLFLHRLWLHCCHRFMRLIERDADWDSTTRAFIASGADCNEMGEYLAVRHNHVIEASLGDLQVRVDRLWLYLSPLMVLRLCFDREPPLSQLEDAFIASGASVCSERTRISVMTRYKGGRARKLDLRLSQRQWDDYIETSERRPNGEFRPRAGRFVAILFQEMDLQQLYDQARQEDSLQKNITQEEASGADIVNTDIESISDGWSIVASDSLDAEIEERPQSSQPSQTLL